MRDAEEQELTLRFNGEEVPMAPFVENLVKGTVLGLVQALKGYEEGADITIEIKK